MDTSALFTKLSVAEIIRNAIHHSKKTQQEIAKEAGFPKPNIITMLKKASTPLPINRIGKLAKAIDIDPAFLFRQTMLEYYPETWQEIEKNLGAPLLTQNERKLIDDWRQMTHNADPSAVFLNDIESSSRLVVMMTIDLKSK